MNKKTLAAYKYTRDVNEAIKFLERFRHREGLQIEINIKGDIGDFFSLAPKVDVSIDNVTCYRFNFACRAFAVGEQGHDIWTNFYLAHWEQVALYQYLHAFPNIPTSWPEAERKIRSRRGDPLKLLREAVENKRDIKITFGA
jgi:hypothetical protein